MQAIKCRYVLKRYISKYGHAEAAKIISRDILRECKTQHELKYCIAEVARTCEQFKTLCYFCILFELVSVCDDLMNMPSIVEESLNNVKLQKDKLTPEQYSYYTNRFNGRTTRSGKVY